MGVVTVSTTGDLLVVRPDGTVSIEATGVVGFAELIDDDLVYRYADRLVTRPIDGDVETVVATGSAIELTGATRSRGVLGVFYIDRSVPDLPVQWSWTADGRRSGLSYDDDDPTLDDLRYASSDPGCGDDCVVEGGGEDGTVANVIGVHVRMTGADFRSELLEVPAGLHFFDLSVGVDRAVITFRDGDGELVPLLVIRVGPNEWEWRTLGIDAAGWTTLQSITEN